MNYTLGNAEYYSPTSLQFIQLKFFLQTHTQRLVPQKHSEGSDVTGTSVAHALNSVMIFYIEK
jgi:hypothetical protein